MQSLSFVTEPDSVNTPAVGLIALQSDETMEHELRHWLPDTVRLFHTRIPNEVVISHDSLQRMKDVLPATAALLPDTTDFKVIVYGCTSGATVIGERDCVAISMGVYFFNYSTWLGKNGLFLEDLYVSPDHRGVGMGKKS